MHPKNLHQDRYNFTELTRASPELKTFVVNNTIDFDNPLAVRALNRALLLHFYDIKYWDIPKHFLCPPIPGRADYIHHVADLFSGKRNLRGLDIGVGANCIYPLIGHKLYGQIFVGSEIDSEALKSAQKILKANHLEKVIELRLQKFPEHIFEGILKNNEKFDFSICNPPFHGSFKEANAGTQRKRKNLGLAKNNKLNFGGKSHELWCKGGEKAFVSQMIEESAKHPKSVTWYTSLISKAEHLGFLEKKLKDCSKVKIIPMSQGQKKSRILAWSW